MLTTAYYCLLLLTTAYYCLLLLTTAYYCLLLLTTTAQGYYTTYGTYLHYSLMILLSIGIYYNPTASPSTIVLSVSMHLPVSIASQELAQN